MNGRYVKSFWTCCAALSALVVVSVLVLPGELQAQKKKKKKEHSPEELTNFLLGPEESIWLVGAIGRIASDEEIADYLRLTSDDEAANFVEEFWARRRSTDSVWPADQPQGIFETRAREADRQFAEGARQGRRSDRGTIHILYGPPEEVKYEVGARPGHESVEVWVYPKDAEPGLDGQRPKRYYYFVRRGEYTVETAAPPRRRLRPGAFDR